MALQSGMVLGRYEILSQLGKGGMGEVYRARDKKLQREVAIKILPVQISDNPNAFHRFEREARTLAALSHPNILNIHDFATAQGIAYAVTELLQGETLRSRIATSPLSFEDAVTIGTSIAEGLAAAHSKGIIHRDLKPENIFLTSTGQVKILDFGLARITEDVTSQQLSEASTKTQSTESGVVRGTVPYMSPEQIRGEAVQSPTDIFAFGCVLYEMLTGSLAFQKETIPDTMSAILKEAPPPLPDSSNPMTAQLQKLIDHCLEKKPDMRLQSARDLVFVLQSIYEFPTAITESPKTFRVRYGRVLAIILVVLAAIAILFAFKLRPVSERTSASGAYGIESLAVLPLKNISGDQSQDYFADGMTEELITKLAGIGSLRVISSTSVMRFKNTAEALPEIAKKLNVDAVVEGSVLKANDRVRITAQLIHAASDRHLWAKSYEYDLRDVLALQNEVASSIAQEVRIRLSGEEKARFEKNPPINAQAYEAYLQGRYLWNRMKAMEVRKSIPFFQDAIARDPTYAAAYSGLSDAYHVLGFFQNMPSQEAFPRAKEAALKALELNESVAEPHISLAGVLFHYEWNFAQAEKEFRRGLQLNPNYSWGHEFYALFLASLGGREQRSLMEIKSALELDPLSPLCHVMAAYVYTNTTRDFDRAIAHSDKVFSLDPTYDFGRAQRINLYARKGQYHEVSVEIQNQLRSQGASEKEIEIAGRIKDENSLHEFWRKQLAELEKLSRPPSYGIAAIYAQLNEKENALKWLERAFKEKDSAIVYMKRGYNFDSIRNDPRFEDLLKRIGFPE